MSVGTQHFALAGGEDLVSPALSIKSGELLLSENYEERLEGGYSRCEGYERFDGQVSPTDSAYQQIPFEAGTAQVLAGDIVTGSISGAVGVAIIDGTLETGSYAGSDATGYIVLSNVTGKFTGTESLQLSSTTVANQAGAAQQASDDTTHAAWTALTVAYTRSLIQPVPGSGAVRGVTMLNGVVFAFRDSVDGATCELYKSSPSGWQSVSTPSLLPGGKYEFVKYNFGGHTSTVMIYGCDGVNKGFEFDGTTYTQISTGMVSDKPVGVVAYRKHLFYAFGGGSIQHSGLGEPLVWTPITGASEIALGDDWTGFSVQVNDSLLITTRNQMYVLYGTSSLDWNLTSFSDTTGAVPNSILRVRNTYLLNDGGITTMSAVQAFGDFSLGTLSRKIQPIIDSLKDSLICSTRVEKKSQIRYFFNKQFLIGTLKQDGSMSFTRGLYPIAPVTIWNGEDLKGNELIFFGSDDGFIYQMDKGTSFDGLEIEAIVRLAFNHLKSPRHRKRFRKIVFEATSKSSVSLKFQAEFSYGTDDVALPLAASADISSVGGYWGAANWNEIVWSGQAVTSAIAEVEGTGINVGMLIYSKSATEMPHTLQGVTIYYSMRRLSR